MAHGWGHEVALSLAAVSCHLFTLLTPIFICEQPPHRHTQHYLGGLTHQYLREHSHVHSGGESETEHGQAAQTLLGHGITAGCEAGSGGMAHIDAAAETINGVADHCSHSTGQISVSQGTVMLRLPPSYYTRSLLICREP